LFTGAEISRAEREASDAVVKITVHIAELRPDDAVHFHRADVKVEKFERRETAKRTVAMMTIDD
jgi:uncharacterized sporulation protein YeaH/YhbH (DUF444 family)